MTPTVTVARSSPPENRLSAADGALREAVISAKAAFHCGYFEEAEGLFARAARLDPTDPHHPYHLGLSLFEQRRYDAALDAFERALSLRSDHERAQFYRRFILSLKGQVPHGWREVWTRRKGAGRDYARDRAELLAILDDPALTTDSRCRTHFSLAALCDEVGDFEGAARHALEANRLQRTRGRPDPRRVVERADQLIETFSQEFLECHRWRGSRSSTPIFIVGMPRSGTTLTEAILARHPLVHPGGELGAPLQAIAAWAGESGIGLPYPACIARLDEHAMKAIASRVLTTMRRDSGGAPHVTDKLPFGYWELGLIQMLFPEARVIHCRRQPLDSGLSTFLNYFFGMPYTASLEDIGRFWLQYRRLMRHWRTRLSLPILALDYEELVADQEGQTRRLLEFCGLPWHEDCLRFYDTGDRTIATLSSLQVRQPMYSDSVGRWRNYRDLLAPLIEMIERTGSRVDDPAISRF